LLVCVCSVTGETKKAKRVKPTEVDENAKPKKAKKPKSKVSETEEEEEVKPKKKKAKPASESEAESEEEEEAKPKKVKKDKNAPRGATTSYIFFSVDNRARVKAANPDINFGDLSRLLAKEWKECSKEDRLKYDTLAEEDKQRYKREKTEYDANHGVKASRKSKKAE